MKKFGKAHTWPSSKSNGTPVRSDSSKSKHGLRPRCSKDGYHHPCQSIAFRRTYPLDSDLSVGKPTFEQLVSDT